MKNCVIIYVIETDFQGRRVQLGASLSKEAAERKCEELKKNHPGKPYAFWTDTYCLTDDFTTFDWI